MPLPITVLPEARLVHIDGSGALTGTDLATACLAMGQDPAWKGEFDQIWDFSGAFQIDITPDELDEIVEITHTFADLVSGNRVVFVSTRDTIAALARLFELRTGDLDRSYHVARTLRDAADWLGLPPGTLEGA